MRRAFDEAGIDAAVHQRIGDLAGVADHQRAVQSRVAPRMTGEDLGEPVRRHRGAGADAQAATAQADPFAHVFQCRPFQRKDAACVLVQRLAGVGQMHAAPCGTVDQWQVQLRLQLTHCLGHRRLADEQRLGRAREARVLHHGGKHAQQVQVQAMS